LADERKSTDDPVRDPDGHSDMGKGSFEQSSQPETMPPNVKGPRHVRIREDEEPVIERPPSKSS
jgi:hypothetical protein